MARSPIHGIHSAGHFTSSRGVKLLRIILTLFLGRGVFATASVKEKDASLTLAPIFTQNILKAICAELKEEFGINPQEELTMENCNDIYGYLTYKHKLQEIEKLDLSSLGINYIPETIFGPMVNLRRLNLSGNLNLDFKLKIFEKIFPRLIELDLSNCNIDEEDFEDICKKSNNLKILKISNNPRIKFPDQRTIGFSNTLKDLRVDNCNLSVADMSKIAKFKSLEKLDISNNWLKRFFQAKSDLGKIKNTLTELIASKVGMTFMYLPRIEECPKLKVLNISCNDLKIEGYTHCLESCSGAAPPRIDNVFLGNLANQLTSLNISKANLKKDQLWDILDSTTIEILDCSFNNFTRIEQKFTIGGSRGVLKDANFSNCLLSSWRFLSEILDCRHLTKLNLSKNRFKLASDNSFAFGSAVNFLEWLDISEAEVEVKSVIRALGKSRKIEYLNLSRNRCCNVLGEEQFDCGKVDSILGDLRLSLKVAKISDCHIENDFGLLYDLMDCKSLEELDVSGNIFSRFPKKFRFGSSSLKRLKMNGCCLDSAYSFRAITDLSALEILSIDKNYRDSAMERLELGISKNSLKTISMRGCGPLDISALQGISQCEALETLGLSETKLSSFYLKTFSFGLAERSLRSIDVADCSISSEVFLKALANCEGLLQLNLGGNKLSELPDDFGFGSSQSTLEILNMSHCSISSQKMLSKVAHFKRLRELDLSDNDFSKISGDFSFGDARHSLKILKMDRCQMENPRMFAAITSCGKLVVLSMAYNSFGSHAFWASKHTLKELNLCGCKCLGVEGLSKIFGFSRLEKLDISHIPLGQFEEKLSLISFENTKETLKELIVAGCQLKKPSILTKFSKLETIDISGNPFDDFPKELGLGKSKDTLLKITAERCGFKDRNIVKALTDCKRLKVLSLNFNHNLGKSGKIVFGVSTGSLKELCLANCGIYLADWICEIKKCTGSWI